jgi:hypothetical protein
LVLVLIFFKKVCLPFAELVALTVGLRQNLQENLLLLLLRFLALVLRWPLSKCLFLCLLEVFLFVAFDNPAFFVFVLF